MVEEELRTEEKKGKKRKTANPTRSPVRQKRVHPAPQSCIARREDEDIWRKSTQTRRRRRRRRRKEKSIASHQSQKHRIDHINHVQSTTNCRHHAANCESSHHHTTPRQCCTRSISASNSMTSSADGSHHAGTVRRSISLQPPQS